jgi:N-acetyl sugar amidotransferase
MPDTRPDTHFEDGICSACRSYARRPEIDWDARMEDLTRLLDRHDGRVIVPSSGGKDSTWQVLTLLELGADVTVVTARTCHLTDIGRRNIDNLARYARTVEVVPNMTVRAKLNRLGLELVGDCSWPEHIAIHRVPFRVACDLKIPLIMYGENPLNQYGSPPGLEDAQRMTQAWVAEYGGFLGLRPQDLAGMEGLTERDMQDYLAPDDAELERLGVAAYFLGQFLPWDSHKNAEAAGAHGFETFGEPPGPANWWIAENLDNSQTGLRDYIMWLKYGYSRGTAQASVDVRSGRLTRDEAMAVAQRCEGAFPEVYAGVTFEEVIGRMGMTRDQFEAAIAPYR